MSVLFHVWRSVPCLYRASLVLALVPALLFADETNHRVLPLEREHIELLRNGGHIIFLRHAERVHGIPGMELVDLAVHVPGVERPSSDMPGYCLTEAGKESAKVFGQMINQLGIPIGKVYSSPICRALQTAELAFGRVDGQAEVLSFVHHHYGDEADLKRHAKRLREFFRKHWREDTNIVMSAHGNMLMPLGVEYDDLQELGFLIFDRNLQVIARANPGELAGLVYELKVPTDATR